VSNEQLYSRYFRYVEEWDRCIVDSDWPDSTLARFPDPYPEAMNDNQRETVWLVAADWVEVQKEAQKDAQPDSMQNLGLVRSTAGDLTAPRIAGGPATWADAQEGLQRRQMLADRRDERNKVVEARRQSLSLALGKASFRALDDYAHELYNASPGKLVRQPFSEGAMYARYLHLIALMDNFAANDNTDGHAAAKARAEEQAACGLADKDELLLQHEADSIRRPLRPGDPISRPRAAIAARNEDTPPEVPHDVPTEAQISVPALRPEERLQMSSQLIDRLQSSLSKAGFAKVEKRVHALYDSEGVERVVAIDEPAPEAKQATMEQAVPKQP
jgi:hypothetical protein